MPWVRGLLPPRSHQLSSRKESWLAMRCCSHLWCTAISTKVNKNELWMMRFNFAYVVPELCQVHSHVQMKTFPVSISTKSRNHMINVGKNHMELCSFSCIHHQDAPGWPTRVLGGAFAAEGPGYPTGLCQVCWPWGVTSNTLQDLKRQHKHICAYSRILPRILIKPYTWVKFKFLEQNKINLRAATFLFLSKNKLRVQFPLW